MQESGSLAALAGRALPKGALLADRAADDPAKKLQDANKKSQQQHQLSSESQLDESRPRTACSPPLSFPFWKTRVFSCR